MASVQLLRRRCGLALPPHIWPGSRCGFRQPSLHPHCLSARFVRTLRRHARRAALLNEAAATDMRPDLLSPAAAERAGAADKAGDDLAGEQEVRKWALITLTGQSRICSGTDIWHGIATVMHQVGANIEDAAGTFMQSPAPIGQSPHAARSSKTSTFMVSAFGTHISPFDVATLQGDSVRVAVAIFVKATVPVSAVAEMTDRLHTQFPALVCTLTVGEAAKVDAGEICTLSSVTDVESVDAGRVGVAESTAATGTLTGTLRLFGRDQCGQLAGVTETLARQKVTILNLQVSIGSADLNTCEFTECPGGTLAENTITIAVFDRNAFDEVAFRKEIQLAASREGYTVTSFILEGQPRRAEELANYLLRRKKLLSEFMTLKLSGM
eukprot:TRINITY_DN56812_c0_g1_i2.p1 TRINITY_DN56812_c0_g1~~TRINITY_DN56812_c0_g1_i2.p1  ORF type:complete len:382 (-),score=64.64 TRINITY_DN56812_c0_g1_i2:426-1571(-)